MVLSPHLFSALAVLLFIALSSQQMGRFFARFRLPLITGFLFTGMATGPHGLGLIPDLALDRLRFADELTIAFIAMAAGAELHLEELRGRLKSIRWGTLGLVSFTFTLTVLTFMLTADLLPFTRSLPASSRWAMALLAATVLVARSPSSAIAVVNELQARGPLTGMILGVTVVLDAVVIVMFATNASVAHALVGGAGLDLLTPLLVAVQVGGSLLLGFFLGRALPWILHLGRGTTPRAAALLVTAYLVFPGTDLLRQTARSTFHREIRLEPLLICMVAAFVATNFTRSRVPLQKTLNVAGPAVYVVFFTLAGASLDLDVLAGTWRIAAILFAIRIISIFMGAYTGGRIAGEPARLNRIAWMGYVTQAGIGLGLAEEIAVEFPGWGNALATVIIAVIVMNQVVGPPLFKWALQLAGEVRAPEAQGETATVHRALIFGWDVQALALARQLDAHGWNARVVSRKLQEMEAVPGSGVQVHPLEGLDRESLLKAGAGRVDALVGLLDDQENLRLAELAAQHFKNAHVVVQLHDRSLKERFHALDAITVHPEMALVGLLDQFVRSPTAASLLLGQDPDQEIVELEVLNPALQGPAIRDLRLPLDTIVLSVHRNGANLISHGHTRLEVGDRMALVGSDESLREVSFQLHARL
ncbi:MAG: monovalent cation:proton antiporter family protein [Acidobacteriota bacterium]